MARPPVRTESNNYRLIDGISHTLNGWIFLPYCKLYEGQSKITEPYLITFELSKMDIYLDDISLKLYDIYLIT